MPTQREKIIKKVREILEDRPDGIRYSELWREIKDALPDTNTKTIHGNLHYLRQKMEEGEIQDISRPERGLYILTKYLGEKGAGETMERIREEDFYEPFADYMMQDLEECTKAIPLGDNKFGDKWGTPDVFGVYKFSETDPIRPPVEIVSVEIKTDERQLITAFGQACSYKLFSHKVYLGIPKDAEKDVSRIESLCLRFGLGLILFNRNNPESPEFEIRTRAIKSEPDYFYVNKYLKLLGGDLKKLF